MSPLFPFGQVVVHGGIAFRVIKQGPHPRLKLCLWPGWLYGVLDTPRSDEKGARPYHKASFEEIKVPAGEPLTMLRSPAIRFEKLQ